MSIRIRGGLLLGTVTALGAACAGCARTSGPPGELVVVVSTDMSIPKDLDTVRVQVLSGAQVRNDAYYPLGSGGLLLPATLGLLAGRDPSLPATVRVIGIGQHRALVLREATVLVPTDRTAMLRLPIEWLCVGSAGDPNAVDPTTDEIVSTCAEGQTCVAGSCVTSTVDVSALPNYAGDAVLPGADGGPPCFDTTACFAGAVSEAVDPTSCTVPIPPGADPARVNVALQPASGAGICADGQCFVPLDRDAVDGWSLAGSVASLPERLCDPLQPDLHVSVMVATGCASKTPTTPTCGSWSRAGAADAGATEGGDSSTGTADGSGGGADAEAGSAFAGDGSADASASGDAGGCAAPCAADQTCVAGACVATVTATGTSCQTGGPGRSNCGPDGQESCCASLVVPAASATPACAAGGAVQVSGARLDRYEVTVGRFRQFLQAAAGGWLPDAGSGTHRHLNQGRGLADGESGAARGTYETGWDAAWNATLVADLDAWSTYAQNGSWTSTAGANENLPMLPLDWYEAYAFCIWDGGFLPSTAEWQAAASGGEGRAYPWSSPPASTTIDCSYADYVGGAGGTACVPSGTDTVGICLADGGSCVPTNPSDVGSEAPKGDGKWGHRDLAGNAREWTLDGDGTLTSCTDCASLTSTASRRFQGGGFTDPASALVVSRCASTAMGGGPSDLGVRCARAP